MHASSLEEMAKFVGTLPHTPLRIADVGSYNVNGSYAAFFGHPAWTYVGLDRRAGPNVHIVLPDEAAWPNVPPDSFDVVVSGQTLEHTLRPWLFMGALVRILKPGGRLCVIAPHTWVHHPSPLDCWRIYPDGMRAIMEDAGLMIEQCYMNPPVDTVGIGRKP